MTTYPCALPLMPQPVHNSWGVVGPRDSGGDIDEGTAWSTWGVQALSAEDAEKRVLAWLDYNYEDDLRGASAEAELIYESQERCTWLVTLRLARPR